METIAVFFMMFKEWMAKVFGGNIYFDVNSEDE